MRGKAYAFLSGVCCFHASIEERSSGLNSSSQSMDRIQSFEEKEAAKFFCAAKPSSLRVYTRAPCSLAISQVRSVEPESTKMISSAIPASEASARGRSNSSLYEIRIAVTGVIGNPKLWLARNLRARAEIMTYPRFVMPSFFHPSDDPTETARWRKRSHRDQRPALARSTGIPSNKIPRQSVLARI